MSMSGSRFLAALPLLFGATTALAGTIEHPVVGGSLVPPGKWPDAVAVLGPDGSCTGTLIAPDVVLTAGHCVGIHPTEIIAGTTNYNTSGGTRVAIDSITPYPNYQHSFDVAVIVLAAPVTTIAPRAVAKRCSFGAFSSDTMVHLVGFGLTDQAGGGANTSLHEAMAPVLDPECSGGNGCRAAVAPAGEFVAGGDGSDSCFGDSGGPVYLDTDHGPILIASVSRALDNSDVPCAGAGIYVRSDKVLAWIEQTAGRSVETDDCTDFSSLDSETPAPSPSSGGCSAVGGAETALWIVLPIGAFRRRRRAVR